MLPWASDGVVLCILPSSVFIFFFPCCDEEYFISSLEKMFIPTCTANAVNGSKKQYGRAFVNSLLLPSIPKVSLIAYRLGIYFLP